MIEGERLIGDGRATAGHLIQQDMTEFGPDWGGGAQLFWTIHEIGARLTLAPEILHAGRYDVFIQFTQASDYGKVTIRLDGGPARPFDGYAPTVRPFRVRIVTAELTAGRHTLVITLVGKNKVSGDTFVGIDRVEFVPVRARPPQKL